MNLNQAYMWLPHGSNLHCIRKMTLTENGSDCEVLFNSNSSFEISPGIVPVTLMVEAFAQAAALYASDKSSTENSSSAGYIFKIESFKSVCPSLKPDVIYTVNLKVIESLLNVLSIEGVFLEQDLVIGEATLLVMQKKAGG